jgi:cyanophycinase
MSVEGYTAKFMFKKNFLTYYTSHDLIKENTDITRLVIIVHGALRNGDVYFTDTLAAAVRHGVAENTIVLAPHFRSERDQREVGEIYFGRKWYQKWKYGYRSQDSDRVSSFTLIDTIIKRISDSNKFPNLRKILVTGHSAGGQFTQRYAIGSKIDREVTVDVEFVPSNPSSYMYLDKARFEFKSGNFELANISPNCLEYNEYIYGPINRANYLNKHSIDELKSIFKQNKLTYLMSEEDKGTDSLDRSCEAMTQGKHRFERAKNFFYYDKKFIGSHRFLSISGIGHEHVDVYESEEAGRVIFGIKPKRSASPHFLYGKIGDTSDYRTNSERLYLLLGGGKNELKGFSTFLRAANGGDVLVISAKSKINHRYTHDLWNMAESLGIKIDSVETLSLLNRKAAEDEFVINKIKNAESIFFTGGNQAKYIERIKGTLAHLAIKERVGTGVPIAGTSAGLAIMGEYIFAAKYGGVTSRYVLKNPHAKEISIIKNFFNAKILENLITDTHFMNRQREGRLLGFMFKTQFDFKLKSLYGVGIDEQTSVVLKGDSMSSHGSGHAYFYKTFFQSVPERQAGDLRFGPIKRIKLIKNKIIKHFKNTDFSSGDVIHF